MGSDLSRSSFRRVALVLLGWCIPASEGQAAPAFNPPSGMCQVDVATVMDPAQAPERDATQTPRPAPEPAEATPPREREVEELVGLLKALADPKGSEAALVAMAKGQPFSLTRYALVLADVRSVVTQIHSTELLAETERAKDMGSETRTWIEHTAKAIDACSKSRFATRGGAAAYERTRAAVTKYRSQLEPLLFQAVAQVPGAQPAPRPPTSGKKGS
jgi:hypothetical protein